MEPLIDDTQEAKIISNVGAELAFQLPLTVSSKFQGLFESLDNESESLGIETYGMSVTTLEEVFIKVRLWGWLSSCTCRTDLASDI